MSRRKYTKVDPTLFLEVNVIGSKEKEQNDRRKAKEKRRRLYREVQRQIEMERIEELGYDTSKIVQYSSCDHSHYVLQGTLLESSWIKWSEKNPDREDAPICCSKCMICKSDMLSSLCLDPKREYQFHLRLRRCRDVFKVEALV